MMIRKGLEDVVAGTTELSLVDGVEGRLLYRGFDIHDLVEHATFEEVVYLLWHGDLPTQEQLNDLREQLASSRALPQEVLAMMEGFPKTAGPMDALRTAVSAMGLYDPEVDDNSREANLRKAIRLTARMATIVASHDRIRNGKEPIPPDPTMNHAANFLYMLKGTVPDELSARAFDVCLILHADHEFNASTFSARVAASTLSDMYSAITSAIATLKGPLHGGANTKVMEMLLEIGVPERVEPYIMKALSEKRRVMGFGHRVYKGEDPRAKPLKRMSQELGEKAGELKWYEISRRIEELLLKEKNLYPNVDFYAASVYYSLGIPMDLYTAIFAVSRISGWTAQVLEQYADNRLIRPRAEYVGPRLRPFIPLQARRVKGA